VTANRDGWDDLDADPTAEVHALAHTGRAMKPLRTDTGNALRFVAAHGGRYRYVPGWGAWLCWDGIRWQRDTLGTVVEAAKDMVTTMMAEAVAMADPDERKKALGWALKSESAHGIEAMLKLARTVPGIPVEPDQLDADPWLLNVANGTINLRAGRLRNHNPADLCTKLAPVHYDPNATAPTWGRFMVDVLPDADLREFVARALGYSLTGNVTEQKMFIANGTGANGKSTMFETMATVLGDYASPAEPELLLDRRDAHPTGIARLQGARLVVAAESDDGRRLAEGVVKRLTGGDTITARYMRADFFNFTPSHKIWLQTNHKPDVRGVDHAIWRRLRLIPFTVTIADENQDHDLPTKLAKESAGILAWAVDGCLRWQAEGLTEPLAVQMATNAYRAEQDLLGAFLNDCCATGDDAGMTAARASSTPTRTGAPPTVRTTPANASLARP